MLPALVLLLAIAGISAWTNAGQFTQPGCNPFALTPEISMSADHWPHSTPLLRNHWRDDPPPKTRRGIVKYWQGWSKIHNIFAFGDSYTSTNFTVNGAQPGHRNPIGNPPYPGITSANGPNYIDFLTATYNDSFIKTYNLGYGGATVNPFLVPTPFGIPVKSFLSQVDEEFLVYYGNSTANGWTASDTLFIIFFGINDVIISYPPQNDTLQYQIIKSYEGLVDQLYSAGARNFLFLNVPPVDRAPLTQDLTARDVQDLAAYVGAFNFRLGALVYNLAMRNSDTTVFAFDVNSLFLDVLQDPARFVETADYQNVTTYCPLYVNGTSDVSSFDVACGIPVNEYLWLNSLHPTYPMHNFIASQISRLLVS